MSRKRKGPKKYTFTSANMGDVTFEIVGTYCDGSYDVEVSTETASECFEEVDAGATDEMFEWLGEQGVQYESARSYWFNASYVASVMLDHDTTQDGLLDEAASLDADYLDRYAEDAGAVIAGE